MRILCYVVFFVSAISPEVLLGDGGFVRPITPRDLAAGVRAQYLDEPEQRAVIHFGDESQSLYLPSI
ncbi:MAG: hypothetical protein AAF488_19855 [Planctomycetota bacterium]